MKFHVVDPAQTSLSWQQNSFPIVNGVVEIPDNMTFHQHLIGNGLIPEEEWQASQKSAADEQPIGPLADELPKPVASAPVETDSRRPAKSKGAPSEQ